jgi:hypothetical protein
MRAAWVILLAVLACVGRPEENTMNADSSPPPIPTSAWDRKEWRGSIPVSYAGFPLNFVGVLQCPSFATNLDVLIDFSNTEMAASQPQSLRLQTYVAVYAQVDNEKKYLAQYVLQTHLGKSGPSPYPDSSLSNPYAAMYQDPGGNTFVIHAGGAAGVLWGVEMTFQPFNPSILTQITNLQVSAIAHGVER